MIGTLCVAYTYLCGTFGCTSNVSLEPVTVPQAKMYCFNIVTLCIIALLCNGIMYYIKHVFADRSAGISTGNPCPRFCGHDGKDFRD